MICLYLREFEMTLDTWAILFAYFHMVIRSLLGPTNLFPVAQIFITQLVIVAVYLGNSGRTWAD